MPFFSGDTPQEFSLRLRRIYVLYTAGFALLILLMALAEILGMPRNWIGYVFLLVTVSLYAGIGIVCRTSDQVEYYVAGRRAGHLQRHGHGGRLDVGGVLHRRGGHALPDRLRRAGLHHGLDRRLRAGGHAAGALPAPLRPVHHPRFHGRALRRQPAAPGWRGLRHPVFLHLSGRADLRRGHHHHPHDRHLVRAGHLRGAGRHAGLFLPGRHAGGDLDPGRAVHHPGDRLSGAGGVAVGQAHRIAGAAGLGRHRVAAGGREGKLSAERHRRDRGAAHLAGAGRRDGPAHRRAARVLDAGEGQAAQPAGPAQRHRRAHGGDPFAGA